MCQFAGKTFELGWLVCAIESEGSISLSWGRGKHKTRRNCQIAPKVNLTNKSKSYIENAVRISKSLNIGCHVAKRSNDCYVITWAGFKRVKSILDVLYPGMVDERKKELAKITLDFIEYRMSLDYLHTPYGEYEKELFLKARDLNNQGRLSKQFIKFSFEDSKESPEAIRSEP